MMAAHSSCLGSKPGQIFVCKPLNRSSLRPAAATRKALLRTRNRVTATALASSAPCGLRLRGTRVSRCPKPKRSPQQTNLRRPCLIVSCRRRGGRLVVSAAVSTDENPSSIMSEIPENDNLRKGCLKNGMRYVIYPNKTPPSRFEAHLEVHAGSVDENEDEQGLAHLVEHVTFLGSRKREGLLGTGARSNAYTDFHHTVFHVHSPLANGFTNEPMLPTVLEALKEIAFAPQFMYSRIEKERRAVLSEAQMMNTIEYRVDCQLLKYLHQENALGERFPIGKTDQIKTWKADMLKKYWYKWYFPANTTLYLVGELDRGVEETEELLSHIFEDVVPGEVPGKKILDNSLLEGPSALKPLRGRQAIRPPVEHVMGCGPMEQGQSPVHVDMFRHPLLQHFMLSVFCKLPVKPIRSQQGLKEMLMLRTILSVLHFRINARYSKQDPPFIGIEVDISDSGREGCSVSTLTVTSEPGDWKGAVQVALQEIRRAQMYGVKPGELKRYLDALMRDSEQAADLADSVPSVENLEFLMESLALEHVVMEQRDSHALMSAVAAEITLEEVNAMCQSMLSFASDYGREQELLDEAAANPSDWTQPGPTRATAVIACVPSFMDISGQSTGGGAPMQRGMSMVTNNHMNVDVMPDVEKSDIPEFQIPEGAVEFEITDKDIQEVLMDQSLEVEEPDDVDVPNDLISDEDLQKLIDERHPEFVPVSNGAKEDPTKSVEGTMGITQRVLSNGVRLNYVHTDNEPKTAHMRMVVPGGRFLDSLETGSSGLGATAVGTRALSESGTVGSWTREQTELFCVSRLINCLFESSEEFLVMDFTFPVGHGGLAAVLQVLHLFLESPAWDEAAVTRSKQIYASNYRTQQKSLEGATVHRVRSSMFGPDHRFMDPSPEEIEQLTPEGLQEVVSKQLSTKDMEISIVGDIDPDEVDEAVLRYIGTVKAGEAVDLSNEKPLTFMTNLQPTERHQVWHLTDSDERACAYIAGAAPSRWNTEIDPKQSTSIIPPVADPPTDEEGKKDPMKTALARSIRRMHPLYPSTVCSLLMEVINSRLFTTVRDQLGLTYDVAFELAQFDRQPRGWWMVHVTSSPDKVGEALTASVNVLRGLKTNPITASEVTRARRTLTTRHESDLQTNAYWIGLLTHLQSEKVPRKTVDCLKDIVPMLKTINETDLQEACSSFDFENEFYTCLGTSGKVAPSQLADQPPVQSPQPGNTAGNPSFMNAILKVAQAVKEGKMKGPQQSS